MIMATLLDGKTLSKKVRAEVTAEVKTLVEAHGVTPHLAVVLVGEDPASSTYVRGKERACKKAGIKSTVIRRDDSVSEDDLLAIIDGLNNDDDVHGILVQLPLPGHIDEDHVIERISPAKDVDGFTATNVARLMAGDDRLAPCTPKGIIRMLDAYDITIEGKECVVIGRSQIVGKPMAHLLLNRNGTVTVCHSRTQHIEDVAKRADILVVAVGKPGFADASFIKEGAAVIDVGISKVDGKLRGDVNFEDVEPIAGHITPVPGGVGPMTIAMLLVNTLTCYKAIVGH
jgi:methylenetetrahydrofolate dehydrogenase (NADP+)/methenyltetrahydrofolate cyclohydrolase